MKITDAFLGEHGAIYPLLDRLEEAGSAAAEDTRIRARLLDATIVSHAHLEDETLFAALEAHLGSELGPVAIMRQEHEEIEATLARLTEVVSDGEAAQLAAHLVRTAREHFAKEEQVLFPMAEQILGADGLERLGEEWARRRLGA